jgi:hypothetical protein
VRANARYNPGGGRSSRYPCGCSNLLGDLVRGFREGDQMESLIQVKGPVHMRGLTGISVAGGKVKRKV